MLSLYWADWELLRYSLQVFCDYEELRIACVHLYLEFRDKDHVVVSSTLG